MLGVGVSGFVLLRRFADLKRQGGLEGVASPGRHPLACSGVCRFVARLWRLELGVRVDVTGSVGWF